MALLQISEPGKSLAPHQRRIAVGIDLGTTNSLVAIVRDALPKVLPDEHGRELLPDRKSTRLNSSHSQQSRMPSSA